MPIPVYFTTKSIVLTAEISNSIRQIVCALP